MWVGFYNTSIAMLLTIILISYLVRHARLSTFGIIITAYLTLAALSIVQTVVVRRLINSWDLVSRFLYYSWAGIIMIALVIILLPVAKQTIFTSLYNTTAVVGTAMVILLYIICFLAIKQSQQDFYHELLRERERLSKDVLEKQRQKIKEDFKIINEVSQTAKAFDLVAENGDTQKDQMIKVVELAYVNRNFEKALEYINKAIEFDQQDHSNNKDYQPDPQLYEIKARILNSLGLVEDAGATSKVAVKIRNEQAVGLNKGKKIFLDSISLENVSIFDSFSWQFTPGINILLGRNGYGKSHLLGLLIAMLYDDKTKVKEWISTSHTNSIAKLNLRGDLPGQDKETELAKKMKEIVILQEKLEADVKRYNDENRDKENAKSATEVFSADMEKLKALNNEIISLQDEINKLTPTIQADANTIRSKTGRVPVLAIPDSRFINKSENTIENIATEQDDLAQYGAYEFLYNIPYAAVIKNALFDASLDHLENNRSFSIEPFNLVQNVIRELSSDKLVTVDNQVQYQDESKFEFVSIDRVSKDGSFQIIVKPEDSTQPLPLQKISQGTFSVLAICCVIHNFLKAIYPGEKDVLKKQAIVIIDELDAHIHPSWQQKLIGILRQYFPGIQFIISAHSPLLIKGCRPYEVSVLRRTAEGKFKIQTISRSLFNMSIEDLHALIFEIESSDADVLRYKEIAVYKDNYIRKLNSLLDSANASPLTEEQTSEVNKLQDLISHIDMAMESYGHTTQKKEKEMDDIMKYQQVAVEHKTPELEKLSRSQNDLLTR
jgi:predicted ATP-binding protein involved in virulence